ncbi:MAG TPA: hypothetical protein VKY65_13280 [Alphaproteobacteria bacterium]|nr:hypothetical protein [Alphaproteobacteria bacterium]
MADNLQADLQTLRAEVNDLRASLAKINDTLVDIVKRRAGEAYEGIQESAGRLRQSVVHEIEQRPVGTALAALGIGLILGMLCSRRSHSHHS